MEFDEDFQEEFNKIVSGDNIKEADATFNPEVFDDTYLNMELALPRDGGETTLARDTKHIKDANGLPIGTSHENPIVYTRVCEVEYAFFFLLLIMIYDYYEARSAISLESDERIFFTPFLGSQTRNIQSTQFLRSNSFLLLFLTIT